MRLIDADALREGLGFADPCEKCDHVYGKYLCADVIWQAVCDAIYEAPTIDAVPRWIPCEERLPEPNVAVLGYAPKFNNIFAVYYDSIYGWMTWSPAYDEPFPSCQGEIVAWMPMPEPWKEEDDEKAQRR